MKDEKDAGNQTNLQKRKFLKQAGALAITAPAAGMILSAASKPALAAVASGSGYAPAPAPAPGQAPVPVKAPFPN
jgi:hypothetical protein